MKSPCCNVELFDVDCDKCNGEGCDDCDNGAIENWGECAECGEQYFLPELEVD